MTDPADLWSQADPDRQGRVAPNSDCQRPGEKDISRKEIPNIGEGDRDMVLIGRLRWIGCVTMFPCPGSDFFHAAL